MRNHYGKLTINKKWHRYFYLDGTLQVFEEKVRKPICWSDEYKIADDSNYFWGIIDKAKIIAFRAALTENLSHKSEGILIYKEFCDFLCEADNYISYDGRKYNKSLTGSLGAYDEILFIGGGLKTIISDLDKKIELDFDLSVDGLSCNVSIKVINVEDPTWFETKQGGKMLSNGNKTSFEPAVVFKFAEQQSICGLHNVVAKIDKALNFLCKDLITYENIVICNDGQIFSFNPNEIAKREYSPSFGGRFLSNIRKEVIKNLFELTIQDKVDIGLIKLINAVNNTSIVIDDFQRLGVVIERYYKGIELKSSEDMENAIALHEKLAGKIATTVAEFEQENNFAVENKLRSFICDAPRIKNFAKRLGDLNNQGSHFSLSKKEIDRFKTLRNSVHGDFIEITKEDAKIFLTICQLMLIKIFKDAGASDGELFNFARI